MKTVHQVCMVQYVNIKFQTSEKSQKEFGTCIHVYLKTGNFFHTCIIPEHYKGMVYQSSKVR
jgi:hypothetical protein